MADDAKGRSQSSEQRGSSRLQKRAPASIQVNPSSTFASGWKVAIPLLSPLIMSPTSPPPKFGDRKPAVVETFKIEESSKSTSWQHPAAPFRFDHQPTPFFSSFVPHCR